MGNILKKQITKYLKEEIKLMIVGLDAGGKTTMLYKTKLDVQTTIPTIGIYLETIEYKNLMIYSWDLNTGLRLGPLYRHYYQMMNGIIIVVDSNDIERMDELKEELHTILKEDLLKGLPLLIFSNKRDLPNSLNENELIDKLDLDLIRYRKWKIQESCAITGEGFYEGMEWMFKNLEIKCNLDESDN
ncbi:adp-ribosylation factor [Anaeramoeba ignava]|uniref:Adp-ribosylation factor n=1 Tax=Anaeramoeba ignava TaxID=1746090 RepID=A0A9Q0LUE3_ANAIG|nr:adp-ribosylation factor [Anaeramoeba ignava]